MTVLAQNLSFPTFYVTLLSKRNPVNVCVWGGVESLNKRLAHIVSP